MNWHDLQREAAAKLQGNSALADERPFIVGVHVVEGQERFFGLIRRSTLAIIDDVQVGPDAGPAAKNYRMNCLHHKLTTENWRTT